MCGKDNPMYGKEPWMKGLTKYTDIRLKVAGEMQSLNQKERWIKLSEFDKNKKIGELTLAANKAKKDTKIEIIIKNKLEEMNIEYVKNYRCSKFVFDFYLPHFNFVIECQGDYWHGNKEFFKILNEIQINNIGRDKRKIDYLKINNIKSLFLWENEIYKNINNLKEIIWQQLIG
jgi:G:T-mismatch repair DNA endonuclease (very short patch repair protein)